MTFGDFLFRLVDDGLLSFIGESENLYQANVHNPEYQEDHDCANTAPSHTSMPQKYKNTSGPLCTP
jgi:hypothetical protein